MAINQCEALTASGERCKNQAGEDGLCSSHARAQNVARYNDADREAPPPEDAPDTGDPLPLQQPSALTAGGSEHGDDLPPPPLPPVVAGQEQPEAPPPPYPPAVGSDRPDQTPEEVFAEAIAPPPPAKLDSKSETAPYIVDDTTVARQGRGRPEPDAPLTQSGRTEERKRRLLELYLEGAISREEFDELANLRGPSPFRQAMPTTDLPPAPRKHADGSVDAFPGQTEGATSGQSEGDRVFFRSQGAERLKQVLPDGREAQFEGSIYSTNDPDIVRMLRARIDKGDALFDEDDPAVIFRCPFCAFQSMGKGAVNKHIRKDHPEHESAQL